MPGHRPGRAAAPAARPLSPPSTPLGLGALALMLGVLYAIERLVGGSEMFSPAWLLLPVLVAAVWFGFRGGMVAGLVASALAGPLLPTFEGGEPQLLSAWLSRGVVFVGIGILTAAAGARMRRVYGELAEAESHYRALVEETPAAAYLERVDPAGSSTFTFVGPRIEEMTGFPAERWVREPDLWDRLLHPEDADRVLAADAHANATHARFREEYRIRGAAGTYAWIQDESVLSDVEMDGTQIWRGLLADVTERKQAEIAAAEAAERVRSLGEERRRLLAALVDAQEQERRRLAEAVHDGPVQVLSALALRLDIQRMQAPAGQAPAGQAPAGQVPWGEADPTMHKLTEEVHRSIGALRGLMVELRPQTLEHGSLGEAIREHLDRRSVQFVDFPEARVVDGLRGQPDLPTRTVLFRIAQEAITNVAKHAHAGELVIRLEQTGGGVLLSVRDDGAGFDTAFGDHTVLGHIGLAAMRERAEAAGGWCRVESVPGHGTKLEAWVPADVEGGPEAGATPATGPGDQVAGEIESA